MSKRIFIYIFLIIIDHVSLLSIEMFKMYYIMYTYKSNIVNNDLIITFIDISSLCVYFEGTVRIFLTRVKIYVFVGM